MSEVEAIAVAKTSPPLFTKKILLPLQALAPKTIRHQGMPDAEKNVQMFTAKNSFLKTFLCTSLGTLSRLTIFAFIFGAQKFSLRKSFFWNASLPPASSR